MKIRPFEVRDKEAIGRIHSNNELPSVCLPDLDNPLFVISQVVEIEDQVALAGFVKLTGEVYLLVDHQIGTPEQRWNALKALAETMEVSARFKGLDDVTVWIPPDLVKSFGPRLQELGFIRSPWVSFTKVVNYT